MERAALQIRAADEVVRVHVAEAARVTARLVVRVPRPHHAATRTRTRRSSATSPGKVAAPRGATNHSQSSTVCPRSDAYTWCRWSALSTTVMTLILVKGAPRGRLPAQTESTG